MSLGQGRAGDKCMLFSKGVGTNACCSAGRSERRWLGQEQVVKPRCYTLEEVRPSVRSMTTKVVWRPVDCGSIDMGWDEAPCQDAKEKIIWG